MNISENLQRILTDKQNIANAINAKGVSCQFSESLDTYADKISRISGGGVDPGHEPVFSDTDPLTFVAIDDNCSLTLENNGYASALASFKYSLDGNTWNSYTPGTEIELKKYKFIQFKNSNGNFNWEQNGRGYAYQFYTNGDFKCYGNVMSLINNQSIMDTYSFQYLFYGTNILTAPALPATTLANYCYSYMFSFCRSLTTAPALPATTLANSCYYGMFESCYKLTTAPTLPATTLQSRCYQYMFEDCIKLNYIKAMFTTTPGTSYTNSWVKGVSSKGTFVKNSAATWTTTGNHAIPTGWTVQTASS